jgi:cytochrome P450/nitrite reductase/ring-hydroxylating ferredoxin subunit
MQSPEHASHAGDVAAGSACLGAVADFDGPGPFTASAGTVDLVLLRAGDGWRAYQGLCPHRGALLGEGELEGGVLICRNHRWKFRTDTGERIGGRQCLASYPVREDSGSLWVDLAPGSGTARTERPVVSIESLPAAPGHLPLVGNTFAVDVERMHSQLLGWARERGPRYRIKLGPVSGVVLTEPEGIQQALRNRPDAITRSAPLEPVFRELGLHGVFSSEGQEWRPQRRLAMRALSHRRLGGLYPTLVKITERLLRRFRRHAAAGTAVDIQDDFMRFTVDLTTTLAFGRDMNTIEGTEGEIIQRHLELIFPLVMKRLTAPVPYWRLVRLPRDRRVDRAIAAVQAWIREVIAETRAELDADPSRAENPTNFLESMLTARDADGKPFSDELISGNALTMLLAGEDTTANSLAWAVHELVDSPEAVSALRREADEVLGDDVVARTLASTERLRQADAVTQETLRLHSVAPLLILTVRKDIVVDDLDVPAGTTLFCVSNAAGLSEDSVARARAFRPDRWLEGDVETYRQTGHMPFGSGPRICPGRSLALLEMRLVLAALYKSFDVERVGDRRDVREVFNFTMAPEGLRVRLRERRSSG